MRGLVAVMPDVQDHRPGQLGKINLIRAKRDHQLGFRRHQIGQPAGLRIAQHQPAHPARGHMDHVKTVPILPNHIVLFSKAKPRLKRALSQPSTANNDRGLLRRAKRIGHCGRQIAQQCHIIAKERRGKSRIPNWPNNKNLSALLHSLSQPHIEQRRFIAHHAAHNQDRIRFLNPRQRGIEIHRRQIARGIGQPRLPPFEQARSQRARQSLGRKHRLAIHQIARDHRQRWPRIDRRHRRKRLGPAHRHQFAIPPQPGLIQTAAR